MCELSSYRGCPAGPGRHFERLAIALRMLHPMFELMGAHGARGEAAAPSAVRNNFVKSKTPRSCVPL